MKTIQLMSVEASKQAIERAALTGEQVDCVLVATVSHLLQTPAIAIAVAH